MKKSIKERKEIYFMKRIIRILTFSLIFCFALNTGISANQITQSNLPPVEPPSEESLKDATVEVYYEYEMYNELQKASELSLSSKGFTPKEINTIKSNTYTDLLKERGKLSTTELKNMGYTDEQISILKNPNATDEQMKVVERANTFTILTLIEKLEYAPVGYTYGIIYVDWQWSTTPFALFTDDFAIGWTNGMAFMDYNDNNKSRYTLFRRNSASGAIGYTTTGLYDNDYVQVGAAVQIPEFSLVQIPSGYTNPQGNSNSRNHTYRGAARVTLKKLGVVSEMEAQGAYAHYAVSVSDISLTAGFPSLTFSKQPYNVYRADDYATVTYY